MNLRFTADPGHGWLHVKRATALQIMGPDFVRLTRFSYQRGGTLYLEEDCDAPLFMECARAQGVQGRGLKANNRRQLARQLVYASRRFCAGSWCHLERNIIIPCVWLRLRALRLLALRLMLTGPLSVLLGRPPLPQDAACNHAP